MLVNLKQSNLHNYLRVLVWIDGNIVCTKKVIKKKESVALPLEEFYFASVKLENFDDEYVKVDLQSDVRYFINDVYKDLNKPIPKGTHKERGFGQPSAMTNME